MPGPHCGMQSHERPDFIFCVSGLPRVYGWKDLKDLLRNDPDMRVRPGWTEMAIVGFSNQTGIHGMFSIKGSDEAQRVYHSLCRKYENGTSLLVHLWDITSLNPVLQNCNCPTFHGSAEHAAYLTAMSVQITEQLNKVFHNSSGSYSHLAPASPTFAPPFQQKTPSLNNGFPPPTNGLTSLQNGISPSQYELSSPQYRVSSMQYGLPSPQYGPPAMQHFLPSPTSNSFSGASSSPVYLASVNGTAVNTSKGAVLMEARGVFISGLSFSATNSDVHELLRQAGNVVRCTIQRNNRTGQMKGTATAFYETDQGAVTAVRMFNGQMHFGRKLTVRLDRETLRPIIVNGSMTS